MSAKHTPGPWIVHQTKGHNFRVYDNSGRSVAAVEADKITHERRYCDARLIAAAPELLAALRLFDEPLLREAILAKLPPFAQSSFQVAIEKARAAIAKAEERNS